MVYGVVLPSIVTRLAKFLTSAHHIPVALPQVMTMDILNIVKCPQETKLWWKKEEV